MVSHGHRLPIDIFGEISAAFDPSSIAGSESSRRILLAGGVVAGKTTIRRDRYSRGYVTLDAWEIFLRLCRGVHYDVPSAFEGPLDLIG